jgi:hypothetical protein
MLRAGRYLVTAGAIVLLAVSGCGGSGDGAATQTTSSLAKAEFLKKAKAICERGTDRIDVLYSKAGEHVPKDDKEEHFMNEAAARIVLPIRREELQKLRALGIPREGGRSIEEFLEALEEGIERGEESHPSLRAVGVPYAFERAYALAGTTPLGACFRG